MNTHISALLQIGLLTTLLSLCTLARSQPPAESTMDQRFQQLAARFVDQFPALSPVGATALGDHRFDHQLDEINDDARQRRTDLCRSFLNELDHIARPQLSRDNQIDHALLRRRLERELWEVEHLREWQWNPILYTQLCGDAIYGLMARDFAAAQDRLKSVTARLEQFPRVLEQIRQTLDPPRVPPVHAETAVKQNPGVLNIIDNMVRPQMDQLEPADRTRLQQAIARATEAIEEHQTWLQDTLQPQAQGDFRLGQQLYDAKLAHTLGSSLTRQEIRERAEYELQRVRQEMYLLAAGVLRKRGSDLPVPDEPTAQQRQQVIAAALALVAADVPPRDGIVPAARRSMEITTAFVREHDIMTIPDDPLEIIIMPEFQRGVSVAYCDSPGPLEVGQRTFYAVAPLPEEWSDEQCDSFLREYNIRSIHNLTVHEAMPGHFVQIAHANRCPSVLRSLLSSGVFIEGWACYTEQMMSEAGLLQDDPLMRLVVLKWYLRTISNAILDQSIHVDGMRRADAMRMMTEDAFQEEREAAGKWTRAQLTSAQLSTYFVGVQEHRDLRQSAERAWGDDFALRRYHDAVVSHGSPPTRFVRAMVLNEPIPD